jgi:hypothetical protein
VAITKRFGYLERYAVLTSCPRTIHWFVSIELLLKEFGAGSVPDTLTRLSPSQFQHSARQALLIRLLRCPLERPARPTPSRHLCLWRRFCRPWRANPAAPCHGCLITGLDCPVVGSVFEHWCASGKLIRVGADGRAQPVKGHPTGKGLQISLQFLRMQRKRNRACCWFLDADFV